MARPSRPVTVVRPLPVAGEKAFYRLATILMIVGVLYWAQTVLLPLALAILFAFALTNLEDVTVRWGFGREWHAPMVFIVLAAFAFGCAFGVFAMVPSWWRHRRAANLRLPTSTARI